MKAQRRSSADAKERIAATGVSAGAPWLGTDAGLKRLDRPRQSPDPLSSQRSRSSEFLPKDPLQRTAALSRKELALGFVEIDPNPLINLLRVGSDW